MRSFGLAFLVLALACGDDDGVADAGTDVGTDVGRDDGGMDGGTDAGDDAGTDAGTDVGELAMGDCTGSADCDGRACLELRPGGWSVCEDELVEATSCSSTPALDSCGCPSEGTPPCEGGQTCVLSPIAPFCGGISPAPTNTCSIDLCSSDGECGDDQFCLPGPVMGRKARACFGMACATNDDCAPGSVCAPVAEPCCGSFTTLACVAPDGCRTSADCPSGETCHVRDGEGVCLDEPPICPA